MSRRAQLKLNDYETKFLVELYKRERILYDPTLDAYRSKSSRAAAVKRISDRLNVAGFGPTEVMIKFKNLRSSYLQELKRIAESEARGEDEIYKPKVSWFKLMHSFIHPFVQSKVTQSNEATSKDSCETNNEKSIIKVENVDIKVESDGEEGLSWDWQETTESTLDFPQGFDSASNTCSSTSKRFKADEMNESTRQVTYKNSGREDSYDYFGKYIASMLRDIGSPKSIKLQQEITVLVTNAFCSEELHSNID